MHSYRKDAACRRRRSISLQSKPSSTNSIFRASLKMVHDVLGHGAVVAAVLFTGGLYERVPRQARACALLLHRRPSLIPILVHICRDGKKSGIRLILAHPGCARAKMDVELHSQKMSPLSHLPPQPPLTPFLQPPAPFLFFISLSLSHLPLHARAHEHAHSCTHTFNDCKRPGKVTTSAKSPAAERGSHPCDDRSSCSAKRPLFKAPATDPRHEL